MRTIGCGGETLGEETSGMGPAEVMGLTINEFYGQTEVNLVLGNCCEIMENRRGSMGRPIPGHGWKWWMETGGVAAAGRGRRGGHPARRTRSCFCGYWGNPEATRRQIHRRLVL